MSQLCQRAPLLLVQLRQHLLSTAEQGFLVNGRYLACYPKKYSNKIMGLSFLIGKRSLFDKNVHVYVCMLVRSDVFNTHTFGMS